MENKLGDLMRTTMTNIEDLVKVSNVVGEPIMAPDGIMLIPLSKASFGFGGGGGDSKNGGRATLNAGSAAGVKIEPLGFLVVKDGNAKMVNVSPQASNGTERLLDIVPQVLDKVDQLFARK